VINFETYHEVRRLSRELNLSPNQIAAETGLNIKVYGIENLRIADGSIMPRVTTGNTMAPCVIIGERAGEILKADNKL
jgi:GMC oxidoreductase